jgi:copper oxidase (laccase) domain-containing protein
MLIESHALSQFPELVYGFSSAADGNMSYKKGDPQADTNNRSFLQQLDIDSDSYQIINPELRHGGNVAVVKSNLFKRGYTEIQKDSGEVTAFEKGPLTYTATSDAHRGIDACISNSSKCLITIRPADCGPLFVYDSNKYVFGLIHCSTASLYSNIVGRAISMMRGYFGSKPEDVHCYLGPCISVDAYELCTTGLYQRVLHKEMTPDEAAAYDPKGKIVEDLQKNGIPETNIEVSNVCTASSEGVFFSNHASNGQDGRRHLAVIGLR